MGKLSINTIRKRYIAIIIIFCVALPISFPSFASDDSDNSSLDAWLTDFLGYEQNGSDVYYTTSFMKVFGSVFAHLGYITDGQDNAQVISNLSTSIASSCLTDDQLSYINLNYEPGSEDYTEYLLSALIDQELLNYDLSARSFLVSSELCSTVKDYLEQEQPSDYVVLNTFSLSDVSSSYLREKSRYQSYIDELSDDEFKLFAFSPYNYVLMSESTYNFTDYGAVIDSTINPTCDDLLSRYAHFKYNVYSPGGYEFTSDSRIQVQLFNVSSLNINSYIRYFRFTFGTSEPDYINSNEFLFSDFPATNRFFVFPVSKDIIYFPVFKDTETFYNYIGGTLGCYRTDPTYSGSGDLVINSNMDPEALYDAISKAIQELDTVSTKDIQSAIQKVTEDYFESLIKNTDDIADNTTQLVSLTEKMLAKLDDIYLDLTGFHSDFLENFSDLLSQVSSGFTNIVNQYSAFQDDLFFKLD
ncbi:MAG: hypothetical protein ACI4DU_10385, partial [Lachnospiraceae bacterium]